MLRSRKGSAMAALPFLLLLFILPNYLRELEGCYASFRYCMVLYS
jgi:hypothetical protein